MRSVQDLQKQVPTAAKKLCWSSKWRTVVYWALLNLHCFVWKTKVCLATAPGSHLKTNATTRETVLAQNNQIRIGEKGEVSRKENTVLRFMS